MANNPIHPGTNVDAMGRYIITAPVEKAFVAYLREGALGLADITPEPGATVTDPRPVISAVLGYAGTINPQSITAEVRDMGEVRFDFDPKTNALRLYLPRDLIDSNVVINVRAKDAATNQTLLASWRFNYQPTAPGVTHQPIGVTPAAAPGARARQQRRQAGHDPGGDGDERRRLARRPFSRNRGPGRDQTRRPRGLRPRRPEDEPLFFLIALRPPRSTS